VSSGAKAQDSIGEFMSELKLRPPKEYNGKIRGENLKLHRAGRKPRTLRRRMQIPYP